ncbi:MAG: PQQ-binding-like beta-propeller repeat protein [Gemmataceae bacterium]|nr:PQQ-binding-like beta-propeller repeat protein [Gemmataceae bacterium]
MTRFLLSAVALTLALTPCKADWPQFRGPTGQGLSDEAGLPTKWSAKENVAWKVPVPGNGWSSPAVVGDRVYLTTATDGGKSCRVLAFAADTGKPLWDKEVVRQVVKRIEGRNSPATPTPAADKDRVYVAFNDGTLAAVKADTGETVWVNRDFPYYSQHGLGASPVLYKDLVLMAYDGSSEGPDKEVGWQKPWDKAVIVAVEKATGKLRWKASRGQSRIAHATPLVVTHGGKDVLVSPAGDVIQGFDPADGKLHWTVKTSGEGLVPSASAADGLAFSASGFGEPTLRAVKLGGSGDVTGSHVAWKDRKHVSMMPSMVAAGGRLYVVTDGGQAACLEAKTGKPVWEERLGGSFSASPVLAGGHLYVLSDAGETFVLKAGDEYELVSRNPLGEQAQASPAASGGRLFIRTKGHLWCVGKP